MHVDSAPGMLVVRWTAKAAGQAESLYWAWVLADEASVSRSNGSMFASGIRSE